MKNVCFFSGDITLFGGTERAASAVSTYLARHYADEYKIHFLSVTAKYDTPHFELEPSIPRTRLRPAAPRGPLSYIPLTRALKKYLVKNKIDILITVDSVLDILFILIKPFVKTQLVSWDHFTFDETLGTRYRTRLRRITAPRADAIVALTDGDRRKYLERIKPKCPVTVIRNPVECTDCEYDINSKTIITVGALVPVKGYDMLIEAAATVLKRHTDWRWLVFGEGECRQELQESIVRHGIERQLLLSGYAENIGAYYAKSAMYVLSSRSEGLPMVLLEAKAHRLPCVAFNVGCGVREIIEDGVNGLLVTPNDPAALAESVSRLIEDKALRAKLSAAAQKDMEIFSPEYIAAQWTTLLKTL